MAACWTVPAAAQAIDRSDRLRVVTTLAVLKDIAQEIGGERVAVESLSDPRQDPHYVQPRPTLMKRARQADMFIEIGLQLELWAQKVVDGSGNTRIQYGQPGRVIASNGIATLELPRVVTREWGDIHPFGNPHVWLDPINVKRIARNIAEALERVDPQHQDVYKTRLRALEERIDVALFGRELVDEVGARKLTRLAELGRLFDYLDESNLRGKLGGWLEAAEVLRGRAIVTYHKSWIYFVNRFGMTIPIEIEEKPGIPPSAKHRDKVIDTVGRDNVSVIAVSSFYDMSASEYISNRTGARVVRIPIDTGAVSGVDTYFELIDHLIKEIGTPLKERTHG
jgi:ABC-type Zn uptake system ZnuABC Zn-binding protein ZnuA